MAELRSKFGKMNICILPNGNGDAIYNEFKLLEAKILDDFSVTKRKAKDVTGGALRKMVWTYMEEKEYIRLYCDGKTLRNVMTYPRRLRRSNFTFLAKGNITAPVKFKYIPYSLLLLFALTNIQCYFNVVDKISCNDCMCLIAKLLNLEKCHHVFEDNLIVTDNDRII